ncbi:MAG: hypothetical protein EPN88_03755 [Bacteroidetes bacterium]|nr:MAG: hypothetical protein EPN88_03755 [Bacteroidota bacterium]
MILISGFIISGCSPRAKYERRLKNELASRVRYDSLFMGLYFGMPEKEFYVHCWNLNHKGLIKQGTSNTTAEYELKNELKYPALMNFYPKFSDGKIYEMPVTFKYKGWAPWNKTLSSKNLQKKVLKWYEKVYGGGFLKVKHPLHGTAYVKINGNRRITIFIQDDLHVWAVLTDMSVKKGWNDSVSAPENIQNDTTKSLKE